MLVFIVTICGMTSTAKRRWSRELETEIDGIAFSSTGPVLLHGYDPPAGGKWIDDVIPGKLGAFDRSSGERLWNAPCEVGYGRGFGAGIGQQGQVIVLGPSQGGHRLVRMSVADGELLEAADIQSFDSAIVASDAVVCSNARMVWALDTLTLTEAWTYGREGERYHDVARLGDVVLVVVSNTDNGIRTFRLSRIGDVVTLAAPVVRPPDFDLDATWESIVTTVEARRIGVSVQADVDAVVLRPLQYVFANRHEILAQEADGRTRVRIHETSPESLAAQLVGFSNARARRSSARTVTPPAPS